MEQKFEQKIDYTELCGEIIQNYKLTVRQGQKLQKYLESEQIVPKEIIIHDTGANGYFGFAKKRQSENTRWVMIGITNKGSKRIRTMWAEIILEPWYLEQIENKKTKKT